jgi:hypothetical protein
VISIGLQSKPNATATAEALKGNEDRLERQKKIIEFFELGVMSQGM